MNLLFDIVCWEFCEPSCQYGREDKKNLNIEPFYAVTVFYFYMALNFQNFIILAFQIRTDLHV